MNRSIKGMASIVTTTLVLMDILAPYLFVVPSLVRAKGDDVEQAIKKTTPKASSNTKTTTKPTVTVDPGKTVPVTVPSPAKTPTSTTKPNTNTNTNNNINSGGDCGVVKSGSWACVDQYDCWQCVNGRFDKSNTASGKSCRSKGAKGACSSENNEGRPAAGIATNTDTKKEGCAVWCSGCGGFCADKQYPNMTCNDAALKACNEQPCYEQGTAACAQKITRQADGCVNSDGQSACWNGYKDVKDENGVIKVYTTCGGDGAKCWKTVADATKENVNFFSAQEKTLVEAMTKWQKENHVDGGTAVVSTDVKNKIAGQKQVEVETNQKDRTKDIQTKLDACQKIGSIAGSGSTSVGDCTQQVIREEKVSDTEKVAATTQIAAKNNQQALTLSEKIKNDCLGVDKLDYQECKQQVIQQAQRTNSATAAAVEQAAKAADAQEKVQKLNETIVAMAYGASYTDKESVTTLKTLCFTAHASTCTSAELQDFATQSLKQSNPGAYNEAKKIQTSEAVATAILKSDRSTLVKICEQDMDYQRSKSAKGCTDSTAYANYKTKTTDFTHQFDETNVLKIQSAVGEMKKTTASLQGATLKGEPVTQKSGISGLVDRISSLLSTQGTTSTDQDSEVPASRADKTGSRVKETETTSTTTKNSVTSLFNTVKNSLFPTKPVSDKNDAKTITPQVGTAGILVSVLSGVKNFPNTILNALFGKNTASQQTTPATTTTTSHVETRQTGFGSLIGQQNTVQQPAVTRTTAETEQSTTSQSTSNVSSTGKYIQVSKSQVNNDKLAVFSIELGNVINQYNDEADAAANKAAFVKSTSLDKYISEHLGQKYPTVFRNKEVQTALQALDNQRSVNVDEEATCVMLAGVLSETGLVPNMVKVDTIKAVKAKALVYADESNRKNWDYVGDWKYIKTGDPRYVKKNWKLEEAKAGDQFVLTGANQNHIGTILKTDTTKGTITVVDANYNLDPTTNKVTGDGRVRVREMTMKDFVQEYGAVNTDGTRDASTIVLMRKTDPYAN